jgi:peptidoglycan/LPS O-acetylase OafA/YrhL
MAFSAGWIDFAHFWSLAVEEHFYLVWPAVVLAAGRKMVPACLLMIVAACACRLLLFRSNAIAAYALTPCRADALAAGGLMAVIAREARFPDRYARGFLILGVAFVACLSLRFGVLSSGLPAMRQFGFSVLAVGFAGVVGVVAASRPGSPSYRFWTMRPLVLLGKYSYGLYVFHQPVGRAVASWLTPSLAPLGPAAAAAIMAALGTSLTLGLAMASFRLIESPFLKLKRYFPGSRAVSGPPVPASGPAALESLVRVG